ncbi:hypothetical protein A2U01_0041170, partial [Trifolium medium]|nr:hypothetical protein [Trifolium medium]
MVDKEDKEKLVHTSLDNPATSPQKKVNGETNVGLKQDKHQINPEVVVQVLAGNNIETGQVDPQRPPVVETPDAAAVIPNVERQTLQKPPSVEVQRDDLNDQALEDVNVVANDNVVEAESEDGQQLEGEHSTTNNRQQQQHMEGNEEHIMNTDEFNSSAEYERTTRI